MQKKSIDMLNGNLVSGIIRYSIPVMLTTVLQLLFNAADLVVVGQFCGSISVAAVSATGSLTNLIVNLFIGMSVGAGVSVAHALGGHQDQTVRQTVHTAIPLALVGGVILTVVGVCFSETFLRWMQTPENVLPLSAKYMRIYFSGMTFTIVYNFAAAILRAAGDTKGPLVYLTVAGVVNVILNVIFVTLFHMNVAGVALATTVSQGISAVLCVIALCRRTDACRLELKAIRFHKAPLSKMLQIGLPAGIQGTLFSISNVIIQSSVNSFNNDAIISGSGASGNLEGFISAAIGGVHQAGLNFIGQNSGAHRYDRVMKIFRISMIYVVIVSAALGGLIYAFGEQLLGIYITDSQEALYYGMIRMRYMCLTYFTLGLMDVSTGCLRGLGASLVPMIITIMGVCVFRIAWIYTVFQIPQYHTMECLYLSYPISWVITFLAQTLAFFIVYRKRVQRLHSAA